MDGQMNCDYINGDSRLTEERGDESCVRVKAHHHIDRPCEEHPGSCAPEQQQGGHQWGISAEIHRQADQDKEDGADSATFETDVKLHFPGGMQIAGQTRLMFQRRYV